MKQTILSLAIIAIAFSSCEQKTEPTTLKENTYYSHAAGHLLEIEKNHPPTDIVHHSVNK